MNKYSYGRYESIPNFYSEEQFYLHSHNDYEIFMFLDGDSKDVVEEKNYSLSKGDIIIIRKHEMHRIFHNSPANYNRIIIMISPEFFSKFNCPEYENAFLGNISKTGNKINSVVAHSSGLYDAIMRLKTYTDDFKKPHSAITDSIMVEILYLINQISSYEKADTSNKTIKNVINYLNSHFTEDVTLDTLCEEFFVSKYHLCHLFKKATGLTVHQYIKQKRLTLVDELKLEGKTLTDAALTAGFCDYSSFYRAYVKLHKKNPAKNSLNKEV